ncbi:hypothetical protein [Geobacter sp. DSM 9736]|uniref:hypothetical protein n=1 Tax=Geobacter sp. DSM 9736 TaxID=1277350 RepID=UPI0012FDD242|nr:hypothetical protein [Geobacter sp. DSM 9736]
MSVLISTAYDVEYHSPDKGSASSGPYSIDTNITLRYFRFFEEFASVPFVSIWNAFRLFLYFKRCVRSDDVVINFLPELTIFPMSPRVKIISVVNDDFASMAPRVTSLWLKFLLSRMTSSSYAALYVSIGLMKKYPCERQLLFYPWSDQKRMEREAHKKTLLYWGYISVAVNLAEFDRIATQIEAKSLGLRILLVGPVDDAVSVLVQDLVAKHECISYHPPAKLEDLDLKDVLFGVELLDPGFKNSQFVEFPNKAPRLLSYGIPLVHSGCRLLDKPFFIEYKGNIEDVVSFVRTYSPEINSAIDDYFEENNSAARFMAIDELIKA